MVFIQEYLKKCKTFLRKKNVDSPELSAELIFAHCLNTSRLEVLISRQILAKKIIKSIAKLIKRRGKGEPLAYLLGKKEFYGRDFLVNSNVLIPRPCTETVIDLCKKFYRKKDKILFLDVGTGSGNLATTLTLEFKRFFGIALDISQGALTTARENVALYGVHRRLLLVRADLISCIKPKSIDLIVANPPYLSPAMVDLAHFEVKNFEPILALLGGEDGLEMARKILLQAESILKPGGRILMELDSSQIEHMVSFLKNRSWVEVSSHKDLEGHLRVISALFR